MSFRLTGQMLGIPVLQFFLVFSFFSMYLQTFANITITLIIRQNGTSDRVTVSKLRDCCPKLRQIRKCYELSRSISTLVTISSWSVINLLSTTL